MAVLSLSDAHLAYGHVPLLDGAGLCARGGRARRADRAQRRRQVVAAEDAGRAREARRRLAAGAAGPAHRSTCRRSRCSTRARRCSTWSAWAWPKRRRCAQRYEAHAEGDDLDALQTRIEALGGWTWEQRVETTLHRLALDGERTLGDAVRRHEEARRAGAGAGRRARRAAARRADQPPRPGRDRLARGAARRCDCDAAAWC